MPEGWVWCRLKEVCTVFGRIGFRGYTRDDLVEKGNGAITLSPSNLINMKLHLTDCTYISWPKYEESPEIQLDINDIVVVKTGSSYGKTSLVDNLTEKTTLNPQLMVLKERKCNSKYLCYFLNTQYMRKNFEDLVNGTAIPTFSQEKFGMKLFPLPPASEQEKIVSRIELIFDKIDLLENYKEDLDTIIKQTKSKILDLAIHGKLVPQDPNDEPAEELLKRIATSDNRPYKKLSGDEIPFELPKTWIWQKLPDLCSIPITDGTHKTPTYSDKENGIPFLSSKDVTSGEIDWSKIKYITKELHEELYKRLAPQKNDILLAKNGTTGIAALVKDNTVFDIYVTLAIIRPISKIIYPQYLLYIINSQFCKNQFNDYLTGIGVPNLHLVDINKTVIPLPPLSEQQRIVLKIEELFKYTDIININIKDC